LPKARAWACANTLDEDVVVVAQRVDRLAEPDQVNGDQVRALVDELVEAVLPVRPLARPSTAPLP
jgi:hypothetical protein